MKSELLFFQNISKESRWVKAQIPALTQCISFIENNLYCPRPPPPPQPTTWLQNSPPPHGPCFVLALSLCHCRPIATPSLWGVRGSLRTEIFGDFICMWWRQGIMNIEGAIPDSTYFCIPPCPIYSSRSGPVPPNPIFFFPPHFLQPGLQL